MPTPRDVLKAEVTRRGTQAAVALWLGVSAAHVSDMLAGKRTPGPRVLAKLGLEKVVRYEVKYRKSRRDGP